MRRSSEANGKISIRILTQDDVQIFKSLRLKAIEEFPQYYLDTLSNASQKGDAQWKEYLSRENKEIFGLFCDADLIGIASIYRTPDDIRQETAQLAMGYIIPEFRGKNLSALMYEARIKWARETKHVTSVHASHRQGNIPSRKAMLGNGFKYIGEEDETFGDGARAISCKYVLNLNDVTKG